MESERTMAYFSMQVALAVGMPTYSGESLLSVNHGGALCT